MPWGFVKTLLSLTQRANNRMETDVPKSHALCKDKSTMRAFPARRSCGR